MTRRNLFLRTIGAALAAMLPCPRKRPIAVRAVPCRNFTAWRLVWKYEDWEVVEYVEELEPAKLLNAMRSEIGATGKQIGTELAAKQITDSMRCFRARS